MITIKIVDCSLNNGNCGKHKCDEITIGNQIISECVCMQGFESISIYDDCIGLTLNNFSLKYI